VSKARSDRCCRPACRSFGSATPTNAADCLFYSSFSFGFFGLKLLGFWRAALWPWPHMSRCINCSGSQTNGASRLYNVRFSCRSRIRRLWRSHCHLRARRFCSRQRLFRSHRHLAACKRLLSRVGTVIAPLAQIHLLPIGTASKDERGQSQRDAYSDDHEPPRGPIPRAQMTSKISRS
jgi:hypothetical protein